jgi:GNAT superfamily N-acetyltransferase
VRDGDRAAGAAIGDRLLDALTGAPSFTIRQAWPADAPRLHELHTASVRTLCRAHYPPDVIDGWMMATRGPENYAPPIERGEIFVVEHGSRIVGFGEAVRGVVIAVYVDPGSVRQGVGSIIIRHALEVAGRGHDGAIRLESTLNAARFYERFGFREVERSTVRRAHVAVPIVIMERK